MLKVEAGHYRDTFRRRVYDVFRDRLPLGTRMVSGWRYQLLHGNWSTLYDTKEEAARQARLAIHDALEGQSTRA